MQPNMIYEKIFVYFILYRYALLRSRFQFGK